MTSTTPKASKNLPCTFKGHRHQPILTLDSRLQNGKVGFCSVKSHTQPAWLQSGLLQVRTTPITLSFGRELTGHCSTCGPHPCRFTDHLGMNGNKIEANSPAQCTQRRVFVPYPLTTLPPDSCLAWSSPPLASSHTTGWSRDHRPACLGHEESLPFSYVVVCVPGESKANWSLVPPNTFLASHKNAEGT